MIYNGKFINVEIPYRYVMTLTLTACPTLRLYTLDTRPDDIRLYRLRGYSHAHGTHAHTSLLYTIALLKPYLAFILSCASLASSERCLCLTSLPDARPVGSGRACRMRGARAIPHTPFALEPNHQLASLSLPSPPLPHPPPLHPAPWVCISANAAADTATKAQREAAAPPPPRSV